MKIYKFELASMVNYLDSMSLNSRASRMRTKFKKMLIEHYQEMIEDIEEIKIENEKDVNKMNLEIQNLIKEQIGIDDTDSTHDILVSVKHSINSDETKKTGEMADVYDRLCDLFDEVSDI